MTQKPTQNEINQGLIADLAQQVGQNQGRLESLEDRLEGIDKRVAHNCQRNEENFQRLDDKIDAIGQQIIAFMAGQQSRVDSLQAEVKDAVANNTKLTTSLTRVKTIITCVGIGLGGIYVLGEYINWGKVSEHMGKTTTQERYDTVKGLFGLRPQHHPEAIDDRKPVGVVDPPEQNKE